MSAGFVLPAAYHRPVSAPRRWSSELLRRSLCGWHLNRQRPGAGRAYRALLRLEHASADELAARQMERLRGHLAWACRETVYYGAAAREAGFDPDRMRELGDLARFPVLTKERLRSEAPRLLAGGGIGPGWQKNASGGSTGEPVELYQDPGYWDESQAAQWLMEGWWGIRPGEPTAMVWGAERDFHSQTRRERMVAAIHQTRWLNVFTVSEAEMAAFAAMLGRWQPPFLAGYASALHLFARFLLRAGGIPIRPRAVKSTAEVLRPAEREAIERAFGAPVYDFYGSREVNVLAAECPAHAGLHVNSWSRVLELVDGAGRPVPPGVPGRVLVTDLSNRALPMIRYENGDVGVWKAAPCPCGRAFPVLERIVGRKSDFIHTPSGKLIHGEYFTHLFYHRPEVRRFQVQQDRLECLRVEVEFQPGADEAALAAVAAALGPEVERRMGPGVRVEFARVEKIERGASGKYSFTRSRLNLPWPEEASPEAAAREASSS